MGLPTYLRSPSPLPPTYPTNRCGKNAEKPPCYLLRNGQMHHRLRFVTCDVFCNKSVTTATGCKNKWDYNFVVRLLRYMNECGTYSFLFFCPIYIVLTPHWKCTIYYSILQYTITPRFQSAGYLSSADVSSASG
jgi:hypothetical protein